MRGLCLLWGSLPPTDPTPAPPTQGLHRITLVFSSAVSALIPRDTHRLTVLLLTEHYSKQPKKQATKKFGGLSMVARTFKQHPGGQPGLKSSRAARTTY